LKEASAGEIPISCIGFYSYLTATRIEDVENMGNMDIFTLIFGTD
jgi:hypothetical protein